MVHSFLTSIGKAIRSVNPDEVREMAGRPLVVGLMAGSASRLDEMWFWLAPEGISEAKREQLANMVYPLGPRLPGMPDKPPKLDLEIWEASVPGRPEHALVYWPANPAATVAEILTRREELGLPLARNFPVFRPQVAEKVISAVCGENSLFAITTSLPSIIPSFLTLPFTVGEFASDTAFLTVNQLRMAFLLAAAHDHPIGYREQKAQVAAVIAGAFGWRAVARTLVSKIPFGGGVIGKAGVAYAGTWVVGRSLERLYRTGGLLNPSERKNVYAEGLTKGRQIAEKFLEAYRAARVKK